MNELTETRIIAEVEAYLARQYKNRLKFKEYARVEQQRHYLRELCIVTVVLVGVMTVGVMVAEMMG